MVEDQLTRDERIRLESLAQAVAMTSALTMVIMKEPTPLEIIEIAEDFEKYIREEDPNVAE
jgi:hypothetical protein